MMQAGSALIFAKRAIWRGLATLCAGLLCTTCWAQEEVAALTVYTMALVSFEPVEGFFLISVDDETSRRLKATIVPAYEQVPLTNVVENASRKWLFGAQFNPGRRIARYQYSLVIIGKGNEYLLVGPVLVELGKSSQFTESVDDLREKLLKRKEVLKSWDLQIKAQEENLERLRADADVIANLGRIVEVKEETDGLRAGIKDLDKDAENLRKFLRLVKTHAAPKNYVGRESQLTKQIAELAAVAKNAEGGEQGRKSQSGQELQQKMAILEQTRTEDYDALQRALIKLRRQRMQLETSRPQSSPALAGPDTSTSRSETKGGPISGIAPRMESPEDYVR